MVRLFTLVLFVLFASPVWADDEHPRPFSAETDAMAEAEAALVRAEERGTRLLLVFGANWCHDSRGLANHFAQDDMTALLNENYELLYIDIAWRERNIDVLNRFGAAAIYGTPTVLIYDPYQGLMNGDTMHSWHTAYSRSHDAVVEYFTVWADARPGSSLAQSTETYAALIAEIDAWEIREAERLNAAYVAHAQMRAEVFGEDGADDEIVARFNTLEREINTHRSMMRADRESLYADAAELVRTALIEEANGEALDFAIARRFDASEPELALEFPSYPPFLLPTGG